MLIYFDEKLFIELFLIYFVTAFLILSSFLAKWPVSSWSDRDSYSEQKFSKYRR
jgi:hypothetical protein